MSKKKEFKWVNVVIRCSAIFLLLILPVVLFIFSPTKTKGFMAIRGDSMTPTVDDGEVVYIQPTKFERGEIVVAHIPYTNDYFALEGVPMIKRIIGLPGEKVELSPEGILINGELLDEPYVLPEDMKNTLSEKNTVTECILSDYEYYLVGDNRETSFDSRNLGAIHAQYFVYGITETPNDHTSKILITTAIIAALNICITSVVFYLTRKKQR